MAKTQKRTEPGAIETLADWILAQRADDLSAAIVNQTRLLLLDTIGCGFAALQEESAKAVIETLAATGGAPRCSVIGSTTKTSAPNAVLVNGSLIRILDLNDYVNTKSGQIGGHPSDNIMVALAAAELSGASGRDTLMAIVIGYEIYGRLKELMDRDSHWDGVTVSGFCAPAMAGRLIGLDRHRLAHALALSGARSVTPLAVRHGDISAAKSVANALVAQNGMQATLLAQYGMTGPLDLFENKHGLASVFPGIADLSRISAPLDGDCYVMGCHVKAYPCLATGQSIVAAGLEIHRQVGGNVGQLGPITVAIADDPVLVRQKNDPGRIDPTSREAADHSFNFLAAVSILDGAFGLAQFDNERWFDRITITNDATLNARSPGGFPCAIVATAGDRRYAAEVLDPPGFSRHGLDEQAVIAKFEAITAPNLPSGARRQIIDAVMAIDGSASVSGISDALMNAATTH
jgi:2-methylcitrate dehydratase